MNMSESEKVPAEKAIVSITKNTDGSITLEMAPEWEHVLPKTNDDDPGCLIMWEYNNLVATVNAFNQAIAVNDDPPPPAWIANLAGGGPITVPGLQAAILNHVNEAAEAGGVVGNCMIAPNTVEEFTTVCIRLYELGLDPFFRANAVCPIGCHFILKDRIHRNTGSPYPIVPLPAAHGVSVFA